MPTRPWSLGQHENSLVSIVIGDGNARVSVITNESLKVNAQSFLFWHLRRYSIQWAAIGPVAPW